MNASATEVKVGTKVVVIDGPGQSLESPANRGAIVEIKPTTFGTIATVRFEDGTEEGFALRSIVDGPCAGIGVYVAPVDPEAPTGPKAIHVRTWTGSLCATVTEMANAGKRGKTCRVLRFSSSGVSTKSPVYGEVLYFLVERLPALSGYESFDDVALLGRALVACAEGFAMHEETIRGIDAPKVPVFVRAANWSLSADDEGVTLCDLRDWINEPRAINNGSNARAYAIAARVAKVLTNPLLSFSEVLDVLRDAGLDMHYYCAVD